VVAAAGFTVGEEHSIINQSIDQSIYLANCATTKMNVNKTL